jgi:hypothetical protein
VPQVALRIFEIVPQVALRIFEAIQEYEKRT